MGDEDEESSSDDESSVEKSKLNNFHLNKSKQNTVGGWSKNNLSLNRNIPENSNDPKTNYTLINPNFLQNNKPNLNNNPMGFRNSNFVLPPNLTLPNQFGMNGNPFGQNNQPININNNITFHNPNFITTTNAS